MTWRTFLLSPAAVFGIAVLLPSALQGSRPNVVYAEAPIAVISNGSLTPGRLAAISTRVMQVMENRLDMRLKMDDLTVRLCRDEADYREAGGLGNTDACYLAPTRILLRDKGGIGGDLAHEYAHALIKEQTHGTCPGWLEEGIINHENYATPTGQYSPKTAARLSAAIETVIAGPKLWSLNSLSEDAQQSRNMSDAFYGAAWSASDYLYRTYGRASVLKAVSAMSAENPDKACRAVLGKDLAELERDWRESEN